MKDEQIIEKLIQIKNDFSTIIDELKTKNGIIATNILDLIDEINHLSVEV